MTPTLLEREAVLADMEALARAAAAGNGQMLLLRGEAGVGKTALLRQFIHRVAGNAEVLVGYCDPLSAPRPLGPFIDMVSQLPEGRAAELAAAIDAGNLESVYRGVLAVLGEGCRWICVVDDGQWADAATLDLLLFLARRIDALPVLIVVSYRDYELGQQHPLTVMLGDMSNHAALTRISLQPLSRQVVYAVAKDNGMDPHHLFMLTGGNPFYINEVVSDSSVIADRNALPRSVIESARGRLARLSAAARDAAEAAAVCGPEIDPRLVEKLCPGAAPGLNECVRAGLLVESDDVVGFRHELIRLAILDQVPGHVRRQLHERAFAASAETRDPAPTSLNEPTGSYAEPEDVARDHGHRAATRADPDHLTRREREILELLAVGHSDAQIAGRLFISQRTVNNHVHAILHKLGVHNRTQAASITRQRPTNTGRVR